MALKKKPALNHKSFDVCIVPSRPSASRAEMWQKLNIMFEAMHRR
jgi:hypothetical protein